MRRGWTAFQGQTQSQSDKKLDVLTRVNLDDMVEAFGVGGRPWLEALVRRAGNRAARGFARTVLAADRTILAHGLAAGAVCGLAALETDVVTYGVENLPRTGPVILASNHPGMTDALALLASLRRDDVRILAARRPFLEALGGFRSALIFIDEAHPTNRAAVRQSVACLHGGGAIITFPAGCIEPDPAVAPGACESLSHWNQSLDLLHRLAPEAAVIPVLISGVISQRAYHTPLRRLRRSRKAQDHLSAILQLSLPGFRSTHVSVRFCAPVRDTPVTPPIIEVLKAMMR